MPATTSTTALLAACGLAACVASSEALAQGDPLGEPFPGVFFLSGLLPGSGGDGSLGYVLEGVDPDDLSGSSVAGVGDVNGDGLDDLMIGAPWARGVRFAAGEVYLVFGRAESPGPVFDLSDLDGHNGVRFLGGTQYSADAAGWSVAGGGDFNGDGLADALVGAPFAYGSYPERTEKGYAYVILGQTGGYPAELVLNALGGVPPRLRVEGYEGYADMGFSVDTAGDFNGDGFDDMLVGAPGASRTSLTREGKAYVIFGDPARSGVLEIRDLQPEEGVEILGADLHDNAGSVVQSAGDFNGDGFDDIIVAGENETRPMGDLATAHVILGKGRAHDPVIDLGTLAAEDGFTLTNLFSPTGVAIARAGDITGDGLDDLVVGQRLADVGGTEHAGEVFVLPGRREPLPERFDLADQLATLGGTRIVGSRGERYLGDIVAPAGDINGDGLDDVLFTARLRDENRVIYVLFGRQGGYPQELATDLIPAGWGVAVQCDASAGILGISSARAAGDVNGDGVDDLIIGARLDLDWRGRTFLVYGRRSGCRPDLDGDGSLTIFDFLAFGNLFDAGDPRADFDDDGALTLFDFLAFQNAFDAGCP